MPAQPKFRILPPVKNCEQIQMPNFNKISAAAALLFLLTAAVLQAQHEEIHIRNFGFEDGLSHRNVFKIQQDTSGFLWVATEKGLNRFDGHNFLPWTSEDAIFHLPADNIRDLTLAKDNRLWLACGNGITIFNSVKNQFDTAQLAGNSFAIGKEHRFGSLLGDDRGGIWTVTYLPGDNLSILQRTNREGKLEDVLRLPGKYEGRPIARQGNQLYVGAFENEIWVIGQDGSLVRQFEFPAPKSEKSFSRVIQLQTAGDGTLWAMLDHGQVYYLPPGASTFSRHPLTDFEADNIHSTSFLVNDRKDIWLAGIVTNGNDTEGSPCSSIQPGVTLLHFDANTGVTKDYSYYLKQALPYAEPPRQIFMDRTGVIWIASTFGLIQLVEHNLFEKYMTDGNDCCSDGVCSMRGMAEDEQGNIYFSYYNSIHVLNPQTGSLTPLFSPEAREVGFPFGILGYKGALWTGDGMRIDLKTLKIDTMLSTNKGPESVVMLDKDGDLWFGCQRSLCFLNPETGTTGDFVDQSGQFGQADFKSITYLCQGITGGFIWIATKENGFFKIKKNEGVLRHFTTKNLPGLQHDRILALAEAGGDLWIASANGLGRMNIASEKLKLYTTQDGLPNNFINGLLIEGDSAVWVSTDNGLSRLDVRSESFTSYFASDGLSKNEFNRISFLRARDGRMYFGGINGVNAFYPGPRYGRRQDVANSRLLFTGFSKFDGEQDERRNWDLANGQKIELTYRDEMFTFQFALADFADPRLHLYSYKLEDWDKEWSKESSMNFARYFNIPAGNYTFRVRAARSGSEWVEDELGIPVEIRQAFYKTAWFKMVMLGLLSVLIFGIMRYRLYRARKHEQELEILVQERTQELETEKHKSEELLLNILPAETAEELKQFGSAKARRFENVTVLFSDFKGFSKLAGEMTPEALVAEIDFCFCAFDKITESFGLEKIKTVGDAYLLAGGISGEADLQDAAVRVVQAGLEIQRFLGEVAKERAGTGKVCFEARVGVHSGQVVAGIVGIKKFAYDIWGDTVNIAERLQSSGEAGKVNISKSTYEQVKDRFECTHRGKIKAKHEREVEMYFADRLKPL